MMKLKSLHVIDSSAGAQKTWAARSSYSLLERWGTHPFPAIYCKPFQQSALNGAITRVRWKYLLLSLIYLNSGHIPSQQDAMCGNYSHALRVIISK